MIDLLRSTLRSFQRSETGVALLGVLVLIAVGVAIDFGFASRDRSALTLPRRAPPDR